MPHCCYRLHFCHVIWRPSEDRVIPLRAETESLSDEQVV